MPAPSCGIHPLPEQLHGQELITQLLALPLSLLDFPPTSVIGYRHEALSRTRFGFAGATAPRDEGNPEVERRSVEQSDTANFSRVADGNAGLGRVFLASGSARELGIHGRYVL
ncbi:hypothetical protein C3E77_10670 [Mycetocola zhujimingii]|nr:hypothetical protein C3E77_10670 [Mycetocola zhujimingii]